MVTVATQLFSCASQRLGTWLEGLKEAAAATPALAFLSYFFFFSLKQDKKDLYEPVCSIPIITSPKEEERLIESSMKVTVLFNCGFMLSVLKHRTHLFFFSLTPNSLLLNCCIIEATINTPTPGMSLLFSPHFSGKVAF